MNTENNPKNEFTEFTELNMSESSNVKKEEKSEPAFWQSVLVGGVPGLLIGFSTSQAIGDIKAGTITEITKPEDEDLAIKVAHSVSDDMSFAEAFAAARAEVGPGGAFVWHGNVYGTYRVDDPEWQNMSDEARTEFSHDVMSQVHPTPYTPTGTEPPIVPANHGGESVDHGGENNGDDVDIHIVGVEQGIAEDGTLVTIGYGTVDGHNANFVDSDGDGEVDTVLIDANDNGSVDQGESINAHGSGLTIEQMAEAASVNAVTTPEEVIYGGTPDYANDDCMPDYTNDADTGSYV